MFSSRKIKYTPDSRKTRGSRIAVALVFATSLVMTGAMDAFAYIDPNTGGYIFQLFFPIISVIAFVYLFLKRQVKMFFLKIINFFKTLIDKVSASRKVSRDDIHKGSE